MSKRRFWFKYVLLTLCQIVICNYLNFSPLVSVSLLPAMVVCIPDSIRTPWAMVIAFLTGLVVDFTAESVPGLNALALVPVALCRSAVLRTIVGEGITDRIDSLSFKTKGFSKISGVMVICVMIFCFVYILADSAGTRPFLYNLIRFAASVLVSYLLSLLIVLAFEPNEKT